MMISIRQRFIPVLLAFGLATGSLPAIAASGADQSRQERSDKQTHRHERALEHFEKRHQALRGKLDLQPAQEAAWNAYLEKSRPRAAHRPEGRTEPAELTAPERMERMLGMMQQREQRMSVRLSAMKELYAVLTPEQQKIFDNAYPSRHRRGH